MNPYPVHDVAEPAFLKRQVTILYCGGQPAFFPHDTYIWIATICNSLCVKIVEMCHSHSNQDQEQFSSQVLHKYV